MCAASPLLLLREAAQTRSDFSLDYSSNVAPASFGNALSVRGEGCAVGSLGAHGEGNVTQRREMSFPSLYMLGH